MMHAAHAGYVPYRALTSLVFIIPFMHVHREGI